MAIWEPGELEAYKKRYGAPFGLETTSETPSYPTGLRTQSLEYNPDGTFFGVASDQPGAGLERGLAEYRAGGGLKSRPEYEHAYNQALGEIRPSEGNLMPKDYQEAQTEIQRMVKVGRAKGYRDNDIIADIRERGLDKIQPVQPKYQEVSKGSGLYQLDPGGVNAPKEIVPRGVEEPKLPSKIEEFEILYPEMKGRRGTEEYRDAFGKMKPDTGSDELEARGRVSRLVNSQLQAKYGKTGARYDNISQQWVFPPNFNQEAFYKDYQALEKGYLKKFGISEVLPEQGIETTEVQGQHPLAGQRPGRYMVDGKEVRWNGDMEL